MLRFNDQAGAICFSFSEGKLAIMIIKDIGESDFKEALDKIGELECELEENGVRFETIHTRTYHPHHLSPAQRTTAIIIDLALPGAVKKITGILEPKKPDEDG